MKATVAALLVSLAACSTEVGTTDGVTQAEAKHRSEFGQFVYDGKPGEAGAVKQVLEYYSANVLTLAGVEDAQDQVGRVGWVTGVDCDEHLWAPSQFGKSYINTAPGPGGFCTMGLTFSCDQIFVVQDDAQPHQFSDSAFAHELAHCASYLMTGDYDSGHHTKVFALDYPEKASAQLASAGL